MEQTRTATWPRSLLLVLPQFLNLQPAKTRGFIAGATSMRVSGWFPVPFLQPADDQPGGLHLRQPGNLRETAQRKCRRAAIRCEARWPIFPDREIEEHFIGDDGHLSRGTNGIQLRDVRTFCEMS